MIYSGMRPIKKREGALTFHGQLFCYCLQLLQEPLTVSEIGKNENPRKQKWTTKIHSVMRPKKKRKSTHLHRLFCHCLQLLQEPLKMSEKRKNEKLPMSANIINSQQSKRQWLICIIFPQKLMES